MKENSKAAASDGLLIFLIVYSGILVYGGFFGSIGMVAMVGLPVSILVGLASALLKCQRMRKVEIGRRQEGGKWTDAVEVGSWRRDGNGYKKHIRLDGARYALYLHEYLGAFSASLVAGDGEKMATFPQFAKNAGGLTYLLRRGISGEIPGSDVKIALYRIEKGKLLMDVGSRFIIDRKTVRAGSVMVAVRDEIGWRVKDGLSSRESMVCALLLGSGIPDLS